jgi:hypothetical protein
MARQASTAVAFSAPRTGRVLPVVSSPLMDKLPSVREAIRLTLQPQPVAKLPRREPSPLPGVWFDVLVAVAFVVGLGLYLTTLR